MSITFSCFCGKSLTVNESLAGTRVVCPKCEARLSVPAAEEPFEDFEVVEEEESSSYGLAPETQFARNDRRDAAPAKKPESANKPDRNAPPSYFIAAFDGTLVSHPKLYRIYRDGDALLVIHAGPFNWWMVDSLKNWAGARDVARQTAAVHGAAGGFGIGLAASVVGIFTGASEARELAKRAAVLDPMSLEQLRTQIISDKASFRLAADTATDVRIYPPSTGILANRKVQGNIVGKFHFAHRPTGKWDLLLLTKQDAKAAIRAFRAALGEEHVDVTLRFKRQVD